jgi:colicin import membrane protein
VRETRADTVQATLLALALHVLLFALALLGMWWTRSTAPLSVAGPVIEAELIDPNALSAAMQQVLRDRPAPAVAQAPPEPQPEPEPDTPPPPQPLPEPAPQVAPVPPQPQPQERVPEPDTREQERVSAQGRADREAREREQEERRRQEQIDLTEQREQQEAAQRQERLSEMERQRRKQLDDIRRRRAEAAREAEQAEQKLDQLQAAQEAARADARASASPPPGNEGDDSDLRAQYAAALQEAILRNWTRPDNIPLGQRCRITIRQIPGGEVIDAQVAADCPYDELGRRSVEAAVLKAQPLPYAGFENVFSRTLLLNFQAADR